jgi:hypothetical protein
MRWLTTRRDNRLRMQPPPSLEPRPCALRYAASLVGACPQNSCPFWEPGGSILDGRCVFEELDVTDNGALATWLPEFRGQLGRARTPEQRDEIRRLFHRLLTEQGQTARARG